MSTSDKGPNAEKREQQLLRIRYNLQRCFSLKNSAPTELELSTAADLLTALELCPDLEWSLVRKTKIHKALKMVRDLSFIPGEQKYKFRRRCAALLDVWESYPSDE